MVDVWRCTTCGKVKDLSGPHLNGKDTVRSDCWPCAKKQTFKREAATASTSKMDSNTQVPLGAKAVTSTPSSAVPVASANPFLAAASAKSSATTTTAAAAAVPQPSGSKPTSDTQAKAVASSASPSDKVVWRCTTCGKVKDLSGPHLNGKDTVRSDCWPCAKKQTFKRESLSSESGGIVGASGAPAAFSAAKKDTHAPFLYTTAAPTKSGTPAKSTTHDKSNPFMGNDTATSVGTFSSAFTAVNVGTNTKASGSATASANPFLQTAAASSSPVLVMEKREGTSPPFTFKAVTPYPTADPSFADPNHMLPKATGSEEGKPFGSAAGWPSQAKGSARSPAKTGGLAAAADNSSATTAVSPDFVWVCSVCHKVKGLSGPHLKGKTSVRSDCWPCGKKQLFILVNRAEMSRRSPSVAAARPQVPAGSISPMIKGNPFLAAASSTPGSPQTPADGNVANTTRISTTASSVATGSAGADVHTATGAGRAGTLPAAAVHHGWLLPVIPPNEAVTDFYLLPQDDTEDELTPEAVFSNPTLSAHRNGELDVHDASGTSGKGAPVTVTITASQRMQALFNIQLLHTYRLRIVEGIPLRAVWSGHVLYVIAEEPPASALQLMMGEKDRLARGGAGNNTGNANTTTPTGHKQHRLLLEGNRAYEAMGRFASLLMAVESKLATSRFRRVRRLFCPSSFSFAAGCCYASQFIPTHPSAAGETAGKTGGSTAPHPSAPRPFTVYGPGADITSAPSIWDRIVDACPLAEPRVVSEEQRIRAAQQLYRRVSWLAMPADMSGAAIQLLLEEAEEQKSKNRSADKSGTAEEDESGVDVVLLPGTMRLEDLPAASALALPVKQF